MPKNFLSKYKLRLFGYRTKKFAKKVYSSGIGRLSRNSKILVLLFLILFISLSAGNILIEKRSGTKAVDVAISEDATYNNNYSFNYEGVTIHTKAVGPDGVSATVGALN